MDISIAIPNTSYKLKIGGEFQHDGAIWRGLDFSFSQISPKIKLQTNIAQAWIEGTPSTSLEKLDFKVYVNGRVVFESNSITAYMSSSPDPSSYGKLFFNTITNQSDYFDLDYSKLPMKNIIIQVNYYAKGGTTVTSTVNEYLTFPKVEVVDLFKASAKITAQDSTDATTNIYLYKEGVSIPILGYKDDGWILITNLQEGTEYLAVFDYNDGRYNAITFVPRDAYIWARINGEHKKGVVWVKVDDTWKRAKATFCRKSTADTWKRGV